MSILEKVVPCTKFADVRVYNDKIEIPRKIEIRNVFGEVAYYEVTADDMGAFLSDMVNRAKANRSQQSVRGGLKMAKIQSFYTNHVVGGTIRVRFEERKYKTYHFKGPREHHERRYRGQIQVCVPVPNTDLMQPLNYEVSEYAHPSAKQCKTFDEFGEGLYAITTKPWDGTGSLSFEDVIVESFVSELGE